MAFNYSKGVPLGDNNQPHFQSPPTITAIATTVKDSATTTSSILILSENTTAIEVHANGGPAFIKWLAQTTVDNSVAGTSVIATGTTANFDHVIPNATFRRFVVPISTGPTNSQSVQGMNKAMGLFQNVAYRGTATSVITITQYGNSNSY